MNRHPSPEWQHGFDAGLNGPNKINCHFSNFATREMTMNWEAGNREGKKVKLEREFEAVKERKLSLVVNSGKNSNQ